MTHHKGIMKRSSLDHQSAEVEEHERLSAVILDGMSQFGEHAFRQIIDALPVAIYTTDAAGRLTYFNPACVELAGRTPEIGNDSWRVTWKQYHPDGTPMPYNKCPMAIALKEGRVVRGVEVIAERPGGMRIWLRPYPTPLFDAEGRVIGGVNLLLDISEGKQAEARIQSDAEDLGKLSKLNELSSRLWNMRSLREGLNEMLTGTIDLLGADFGNIQILDTQRKLLLIEAQRGFQNEFLDFFREVSAEDGSCCGRALRNGERIIVEDVETDPDFAPMLHILRAAGCRAVQSTPLMDRDGRPLGMISTHFRTVHRPSKPDLRLLDLYARQASNFIERCRTDEQHEAELVVTKLLADASAEIVCGDDVEVVYEKIMDAVVGIMRADFASMQMLDPERGTSGSGEVLRLLASRGFTPQGAKFWEWVRAGSECTCGIALVTGKRCIDADIANSQVITNTPNREAYLQAGIGAGQSTPLISRSGKLIGMISTHWRQPHLPSERDLRLLDVLARQTADLIDHKKSEESLRESEGRFRILADNMAQLAWTCDQFGNITWGNRRWLDYTGLSFKEMKDWDWSKVLHPDHLERVVTRVKHSAETGEPWEDEFPMRGRNGQYRWFLSSTIPIRNEQGEIVRWFSTNTDVTEQHVAEEALRENDRRKDEFLAMLAHELRNPLAAIRNTTEVLKRSGPTEANKQAACEVIEQQSQHLTRLVDDLLDVSRITQGKISLQRELLELSTIINRAVEASRPLLERRRHQLVIALSPESLRIEGDLTRLVQVVSNLLNNAVKYTNEGGCIRIEAAVEGGEAVVRVCDNGIGMPAELLPHVFNLFTQADPSFDRSQGGLGIGLTLVRRLAELHGGRVEARSEGPGRGSEFILRLPLAQVQTSASGTLRTEVSRPNAGRLTPLRVLLVEDNADSAAMMSILLKMNGYETQLVYDGSAALDVARAFQPQVILCDIGLPGMDGYEVAEQLRAQPEFKQARIIALSGYGQSEDRRRGKEAVFDYHLTKPVELDELTALLDSLHPDAHAVKLERP